MGIFQRILKQKRSKTSAIIVAAGSATRMNGIDKAMATINGKPVLFRTIWEFAINDMIDEIIVVTRPDLVDTVEHWKKISELGKLKTVVTGGADRAESVMRGMAQVHKSMDLVAVHDGARPLVSQEIITKTVCKAAETGASAPAIGVKDTLKVVEQNLITSTPNRDRLRAVQTPQIFDKDLLAGGLYKAKTEGISITDDCSAVELIGMKVYLTEGSEENIKITTPLDLKLAKLILEGRTEV
ncbi:MAG: 2-C-methyl-D-erythritol 4-phosphate cytidylyltransferase [Eubacteriales bacterium]